VFSRGIARPGTRRVLFAASVAAMWVLAAAGPAAAHASLLEVTPSQGSVQAQQPSAVKMRFSEPVQITPGSVTITDPAGETVQGLSPRSDPTDGATMVVELPDGLGEGTYHVLWRVVSLDTHPVQGRFDFAIGHASSPLVDAEGSSLQGPSLLGGAGRALAIAGALCVVGLASFPLLVLAPARRRLAPTGLGPALMAQSFGRLGVPLMASAAAALLGTAAVLADTARGAGSPVLDTAVETRAGLLLVARVVLLAVVVGVLAGPATGPSPSRTRMAMALSAAVGVLATFSLSGHAAAGADRGVALSFDLAHLAAAGIWTGGLLGLALAGIPAAQSVARGSARLTGDSAAALFSSFSVVAQLAMAAVLVTGLYAVLLQVSDLADLGETRWGIELVLKLALWASVLLFAGANVSTFLPTLTRKAARAARRLAAADQLRSAVRIEIGIAAGLVLVAAIMSATPQPAQERLADAQRAALDHVETANATGVARAYVARVRTTRTGAGSGTPTVLDVALSFERRPARAAAVTATLTDVRGNDLDVPLEVRRPGRWSSAPLPVPPGRYHLTTRFSRPTQTVRIPVDIVVPPPPPGVVAAAAGKVGGAPEARARRALELTASGTAILLALAAAAFGRRRTRPSEPPKGAAGAARPGFLGGTRP